MWIYCIGVTRDESDHSVLSDGSDESDTAFPTVMAVMRVIAVFLDDHKRWDEVMLSNYLTDCVELE